MSRSAEEIREYSRQYYEKNRERIKKRIGEYYKNNKDKAILYAKRHREKDLERYAKLRKEWYENNRIEVIEQVNKNYIYNSKNLTDAYVDKIARSFGIDNNDINQELRDWFRLRIKIVRLIKKIKEKLNMKNKKLIIKNDDEIVSMNVDEIKTFNDFNNAFGALAKHALNTNSMKKLNVASLRANILKLGVNLKIQHIQEQIKIIKLPKEQQKALLGE